MLFLLVFACHTHKLGPILTDYIYHQNEKSKPREMDLPFLKNDITKNFEALEFKFSFQLSVI